jgi:hypothetical protein
MCASQLQSFLASQWPLQLQLMTAPWFLKELRILAQPVLHDSMNHFIVFHHFLKRPRDT